MIRFDPLFIEAIDNDSLAEYAFSAQDEEKRLEPGEACVNASSAYIFIAGIDPTKNLYIGHYHGQDIRVEINNASPTCGMNEMLANVRMEVRKTSVASPETEMSYLDDAGDLWFRNRAKYDADNEWINVRTLETGPHSTLWQAVTVMIFVEPVKQL